MKLIDHLEEWLIASLMAIATLIIFVAVVHRYATGIPLLQDYALAINMSWAQELCIYLFVWMAKFGAAYGVRTGIHVGVDVLINRLSARNRAAFVYFGLFAGALFTGVIGFLGAKLVASLGGPRIAHVAGVSCDSARVVVDVFSLPTSRVEFSSHR
jgi:C4-dicarboxylate transporter, DctQ subunit